MGEGTKPIQDLRTKFSPELIAALCGHLELGATRTDACAAEGIARETLYLWMRDKPDVFNAITRAEAVPLNKAAARIVAEAAKTDGDWRAALELLKRRRRNEWGDNTTISTDKRVAELIADIFGEDATGGGSGGGTSESPESKSG